AWGSSVRSRTSPIMTGSGTSNPWSISFLASSPSGVRFAIASRSMSPVEIKAHPRSLASRRPWVPLPTPGGPSSTTCTSHPRPAADAAALHETLVVPHEQVRLHLLQRAERHAPHDQHAGPAEADRPHLEQRDEDVREHRDGGEEERPRERDARQHLVDVLRRVAAGADARNEAAVLAHVLRQV